MNFYITVNKGRSIIELREDTDMKERIVSMLLATIECKPGDTFHVISNLNKDASEVNIRFNKKDAYTKCELAMLAM